LLLAFWQAFMIMLREKPAAVVGFGGYISFPGGMMAVLAGARLVLHEQNAVAGMANRVLALVADRVLTAFPDVLPGATRTGNPVRAEILALPAPAERYGARTGALAVLVVGGSLGAQALNEVMPKAVARIPAPLRPRVRHQSGQGREQALAAAYAGLGVEATVSEFIDDMAAAYAEADLVICRAGATTVAEVACAGVAALFVPFPHAVDDHQTANARSLADHGAALLIAQTELTSERLGDLIAGLARADCRVIAEKAREWARPDATDVVARACLDFVERR
jgi:UDP-N-acetylglucosamine--N-acetylmuramyl-(pentapeptide) pyrophosphoryl-undecaprenol N-acetylglucosamine transferase